MHQGGYFSGILRKRAGVRGILAAILLFMHDHNLVVARLHVGRIIHPGGVNLHCITIIEHGAILRIDKSRGESMQKNQQNQQTERGHGCKNRQLGTGKYRDGTLVEHQVQLVDGTSTQAIGDLIIMVWPEAGGREI